MPPVVIVKVYTGDRTLLAVVPVRCEALASESDEEIIALVLTHLVEQRRASKAEASAFLYRIER